MVHLKTTNTNLETESEQEALDNAMIQKYKTLYPYWAKHPEGWNYPAACASGVAGRGGWGASVDRQGGNVQLLLSLR
jgi:hypothetical protein